jgi:CcmD family protein
MYKFLILILSLQFIYLTNILAQDTVSINGKHYQFIQGASDTIKGNSNSYIIKYIVEPEEAEGLRSNGKIYVVVTVLATIFAGIFVYLVILDRKISKLEKEKIS